MGDVPLSIVIGSHNAARVIAICLQALEPQRAHAVFEVIVADCSSDGTPDIIKRQFPSVLVLPVDGPASLAELRGRGIAAARGAIIAILDPFSVPAADWASQVLAAHARQQNRVIGGSVDLYRAESASYAAWATYLNEYGLFMPPVTSGETWILAGSNVSYKRAALFDGDRPRYPVFWKTSVNWEQEAGGSRLWLEPAVRVALYKPIPFQEFLHSRFHHGRCFAGMRILNASWWTRLARAGSTILLPPLQLWRWTAGFWPKRRHRGRFIASLPAQFLLFLVWSAGEACGYLRGTGRACERTIY
jgi:glycosyltransferase involved in cell wall biosynthesis